MTHMQTRRLMMLSLTRILLIASTLLVGLAHGSTTTSATASSWSQLDRRDFIVKGLEDIQPAYAEFDGEMYAGLIPMDNGHDRTGKLMFWMFVPRETANPDSLTIWLNGGPGCTSFGAGLSMENSPVTYPSRPAGYCCMHSEEPWVYNRYSWTNASAMLYLEQPVGVGFSYGGPEPVDEDEVSGDVYAWLMNFYQVFEEYQSAPLYFFGESYAGYYVPAIAHRIYQENLKLAKNDLDGVFRSHVNLAGIALGNGWADAEIQGPAAIDYAYWHGMIDLYTHGNLHAEWKRCLTMGSAYHPDPPFHPFNAPDECALMLATLQAAGAGVLDGKEFDFPLAEGPNTYDVTTWDPYRIIAFDNTSSNQIFFNNPRVKKRLHAPMDTNWRGCVHGAGRRRRHRNRRRLFLDDDRPLSTVPYIAELLNAGIRVLAYNGDRDLSTCAQGTEAYLNGMEWNGVNDWKQAERALWIVRNDVTGKQEMAGYAKAHLGLSFVVVYNSGHMVPFNQPVAALDLIKRFVLNQSFMDQVLPTFESKEQPIIVQSLKSTVQSEVGGFSWEHMVFLLSVAAVAFAAGYWMSSYGRKSDYEIISDSEEVAMSDNQ